MAETLVQRPTPVDVRQSSPIIILDDSDDEHEMDFHIEYAQRARHFPQPARTQDIIVLDDSDDDIQEVAGPSNARVNTNARPLRVGGSLADALPHIQRRSVIFSPTPPPQDNNIPPVPPLPIQARVRSPPLRYRLPEHPRALRPMDVPLPFENDFRPALPLQNRQQELPPRPYIPPPRERERPQRSNSMGLGGALMALNRQNNVMAEIQARQADRQGPMWGTLDFITNVPRVMMRLVGFGGGSELEGHFPAVGHGEDNFHLFPNRDDGPFDDTVVDERRDGRLPPHVLRATAAYKKLYTHPKPLELGYTCDFMPAEVTFVSDSPSFNSQEPQETGTTLVCASCNDPLVINVVGSEAELRAQRIWGLRCGHILDGKCVEALMRRPSTIDLGQILPGEEIEAAPNTNKGKRKADIFVIEESSRISNDKGKTPAHLANNMDAQGASLISDVHSIRSRLRPRGVPSVESSSTFGSDIGEGSTSDYWQAPTRPSRGRRAARSGRGRGGGRGRGRGKGKVTRRPVIQDQYDWFCPVGNCRRLHRSLLIEGQWVMDSELDLGAIPVYA